MLRDVVLMKCLEVWESRVRGDLSMESGVAGINIGCRKSYCKAAFICREYKLTKWLRPVKYGCNACFEINL
jgi:hypothetical protein